MCWNLCQTKNEINVFNHMRVRVVKGNIETLIYGCPHEICQKASAKIHGKSEFLSSKLGRGDPKKKSDLVSLQMQIM